jgi:acyl-CoA synthetase (AMP-forming)/AMP-acid ligase II
MVRPIRQSRRAASGTAPRWLAPEPELTAAATDGQGRWRTGDLGRLDEAGYLRVTGRLKIQKFVLRERLGCGPPSPRGRAGQRNAATWRAAAATTVGWLLLP